MNQKIALWLFVLWQFVPGVLAEDTNTTDTADERLVESYLAGSRMIVPESERSFPGIFSERFSFRITNVFQPYHSFDLMVEEKLTASRLVDLYQASGKSVTMSAFRSTLRDFPLNNVSVPSLIKGRFASAVENTFTGLDEKDNLPSFVNGEGLDYRNPIRRPLGLHGGLRPWSTRDPYAFAALGGREGRDEEMWNLNARLYYEDWRDPQVEVIGSLDISRNWLAMGDIRITSLRHYLWGGGRTIGEPIIARVGIQGKLLGGVVYLGGGYPSNILLTFSLHF